MSALYKTCYRRLRGEDPTLDLRGDYRKWDLKTGITNKVNRETDFKNLLKRVG